MHRLVRDLYKQLMWLGRDYPGGLDQVRRVAKRHFFANKDLSTEAEIRKAVASGRWYINHELIPVIQLKKYRSLKKSYYDTPDPAAEDSDPKNSQ